MHSPPPCTSRLPLAVRLRAPVFHSRFLWSLPCRILIRKICGKKFFFLQVRKINFGRTLMKWKVIYDQMCSESIVNVVKFYWKRLLKEMLINLCCRENCIIINVENLKPSIPWRLSRLFCKISLIRHVSKKNTKQKVCINLYFHELSHLKHRSVKKHVKISVAVFVWPKFNIITISVPMIFLDFAAYFQRSRKLWR